MTVSPLPAEISAPLRSSVSRTTTRCAISLLQGVCGAEQGYGNVADGNYLVIKSTHSGCTCGTRARDREIMRAPLNVDSSHPQAAGVALSIPPATFYNPDRQQFASRLMSRRPDRFPD